MDIFDDIKKAFIERCKQHAIEHGDFVAKAYLKYVDDVTKNGNLPNRSDDWATDCFAFVYTNVIRGNPDHYFHYFDMMFPQVRNER